MKIIFNKEKVEEIYKNKENEWNKEKAAGLFKCTRNRIMVISALLIAIAMSIYLVLITCINEEDNTMRVLAIIGGLFINIIFAMTANLFLDNIKSDMVYYHRPFNNKDKSFVCEYYRLANNRDIVVDYIFISDTKCLSGTKEVKAKIIDKDGTVTYKHLGYVDIKNNVNFETPHLDISKQMLLMPDNDKNSLMNENTLKCKPVFD